MSEPLPHQADDPEAPYFETLFAVAQQLRPGITRAEALATLHEADPEDTLRIGEPWTPGPDGGGGERWSDTPCGTCGYCPPCQCPGNPFGTPATESPA